MDMIQPLSVMTPCDADCLGHSTESIKTAIEEKLGFIPPFFSAATHTPQVFENLWLQTLSAYLDNPLPDLFKEKLSAYLSRFCAVPYCMICHSCTLHALGMHARDVLALLEASPPTAADLDDHISILAAQAPIADGEQLDTALGDSVLTCAIFMALQTEQTERCRITLQRVLGDANYQHLVAFIAYTKTCHIWMEANPNVLYEADLRIQGHFDSLIQEDADLADFFTHYWERVKRDRQTWATQQAEHAERQRTEAVLRRADEENRSLARAVASTSEGVIITDPNLPDNPIIYANPAFLRMTGYELEEVLGSNCRFLQGPDTDRQVVAKIRWAIAQRQEITATLLNYRKDGRPFWNELKIAPVWSETGDLLHFVGVQTDISDRKHAEQSLHEQAQLLDLAQDAILVRTMDDQITFWNRSAETIYGWTKQEALGQSAHDLLQPSANKPLSEITALLLEQGYWEGELTYIRHDGQRIVMTSRWALQRHADGHPIAILEINSDITEQKALESQFLRAQRMESIGTLAGGIAHDLNNVLTPILSSSQLLLRQTPPENKKQLQLLDIMQNSARRGASLIQQVLSFARGVEGKRVPLQLRHLISEIRQIAQETFPKSIDLSLDIARDLWLVSGDATQLHQVLMNLCVNARDAMLDGGTLTLSATNLWIDDHYAQMNLDAHAGPHVMVTVTDTGNGMPTKTLERIFEPFFTTKELGKGTGLGLSTVLAIVKSHQGFVEVNSVVGRGSVFKVYLPAVNTHETDLVQDDDALPGQGELILVVDDEGAIRDTNQASLESYNYQVVSASDGIEAIARYVEHRDRIQLALVDLMMPAMDGPTTIRALKKLNPQIKIVAVSGLMSSSQLSTSISSEIHAFLPKPYTAREMVKCIAEVLSQD